MSSYQHKCILGNFLRDSLPDYLTCGYCAKEFLLDNITLFIAHKMGGCDKNSHFRTSYLPPVEDTSAPLTCSSCSRVFMTARGLLHHVQEDHQLVLCLQKGPIFLSDTSIKPPPAHSAASMTEFTTSENSRCCCSRTISASDQSEQPTDLSMTCSNSLGKARVKCCEDACEITIEPNSNLVSTDPPTPGSTLPKKRKFIFVQKDGQKFNSDMNIISDNTADGSDVVNDNDDSSSTDSNISGSEQTTDRTMCDTNVSISVTAEYQKDTLCCVSLSTEKKEPDKHAKLKRLLQNNTLKGEQDELRVQTSDTQSTRVVYKVPFLAPPDLESATLKASTAERLGKKSSEFDNLEFSTVEAQTKSPRPHKSKALPESTLEQKTDNMINSSATSDFNPEDLEILSLPEHSPFSGKHLQDSVSLLSLASFPCSPRLIIPDEKNKHPFSSVFNFSSLDFGDKRNIVSDISQRKNLPVEGLSHQTNSVTLLSSMLSVTSPPQISCTRNQIEYLTNPLNSTNTLASSTNFPDSEPSLIYRDSTFSKSNNKMYFKKQNKIGQLSDREHSSNILMRETKIPTGQFQAAPAVPVHDNPSNCSPPRQQWLSIQSEDLDQAVMDTEDFNGVDVKALKKRRYPTSRPFKCGSCDQAFNQRIHLKKHMSKHTGVKPFKCQQCDYSTVERSHLKVHNRVHTGEKPYRCVYCDYATAQNSTLKIHLKRHHDGQTISDFSNLRDTSQPAGSHDDDEGSFQTTFFLNIPQNSQNSGRDLSRSASALAGKILQSLSTEDTSQLDGIKGGDTCSNSSSSSSCTGHMLESLLYIPSLRQVQGEHSTCISDKLLLQDEGHTPHKRKLRRDHRDNGGVHNVETTIKNRSPKEDTYRDLASTIESQTNTGQERDSFNCQILEDATSFTNIAQPNITKGFQSASVNAILAHKEDSLQQHMDSDVLNSHKRKKQCNSKLSTKNNSLLAIIEGSEIMKLQKHHEDQSQSYSFIDPGIAKQKQPDEKSDSGDQVERVNGKTENIVDSTNELVKMIAPQDISSEMVIVSDHIEDNQKESDIHGSPGVNYAVIPEKAFVRG